MRGPLTKERRASKGSDQSFDVCTLDALPVHVAIVDRDGKVRAANRLWENQPLETFCQNDALGNGGDFLQACELAVQQNIESAADIARGLRQILDEECDSFSIEYAVHDSQPERWIKLVAGPAQFEGRTAAVVTQVEIARQKPADQERDRLFEQSLGLLCIIGFDGYLKRWNPAWCGVLGYPYEEMMSIRLRELLHADDRDRVFQARDQLVSGRDSMAVETRVRCKDGSYKWILWNAVPCLEQQVLFATGQDITRRKRAEQQLRESQERFQLIATATKDAVWDWDLRENRLWRNDSYRASYGESNDATESPVEWWRNRIHPDDRERILRSMPPPVNDSGQQWTLEYRLRRTDGTYAHVYDRGFVIFDGEGAPVRMVGTIMDISERRRAEEAAHMQRAELAHIARVSTMGEIATGLAHELNQPLAAISNYAASCAGDRRGLVGHR